jgi:hypothetical protein
MKRGDSEDMALSIKILDEWVLMFKFKKLLDTIENEPVVGSKAYSEHLARIEVLRP